MELQIQGKCMPLTESIRSHAAERFTRLSRRFDRALNIHLWLGESGKHSQQKEACATIHVKGKELRLECHDDNLYVAIDKLAEICGNALTREKEKRSRRRWKALAAKDARKVGSESELGLRGAALVGRLGEPDIAGQDSDALLAHELESEDFIEAPKMERAQRSERREELKAA